MFLKFTGWVVWPASFLIFSGMFAWAYVGARALHVLP